MASAAHELVVDEVTGSHATVRFNGHTQPPTLSIHPSASVAPDYSMAAYGTPSAGSKAVSQPILAQFTHILPLLVHVSKLDLGQLQRQSRNASKAMQVLSKHNTKPVSTQSMPQLAYLLLLPLRNFVAHLLHL